MRLRHRLALAVTDFLLVAAGLLLALGLRVEFDLEIMGRYLAGPEVWIYPAIATVAVVVFALFGLYEKVWRYAGMHELLEIVLAVSVWTVPFQTIVLVGGGAMVPRTVPILAWFVCIFLCGGVRFLLRLASERSGRPRGLRRALVIGANDACDAILRDLTRQASPTFHPVGILDDDPDRRRARIHGVRVLGPVEDLPQVAEEQAVSDLVLAQPTPAEVRRVMQLRGTTGLRLQVVPSISDVVGGHIQVSQIRAVQIEDLLERDPVTVDMDQACAYLRGRRVLVTGAGGSIGSEICRQAARYAAAPLVLVGRGENSIYEAMLELRGHDVVPIVADVRDPGRMAEVFREHRPEVVFHAAAHKHVPLMERNVPEAVANNVFGTLLLMDLCEEHGVEKLIVISTDKAVNPTSVMGATKRLGELLLARRASKGFAAVRFGNVLDSRGSVIPTFRRQIAQGGPVTVTDPEMTRFFMTIPEAVTLVLQAGAMARGGEIYVLDMGQPVKILDLARNMIRLSGFEPERDIPIEVVGARPGEKLHEELVNTGEEVEATTFPKIRRVVSPPPPAPWPGDDVERLRQAMEASDAPRCVEVLQRLVPNFHPAAQKR